MALAHGSGHLDVVIRNAINAGDIPGPRTLAASPELRNFGLLKHARVVSFVDEFLAGRNHDEMAVWRLYTLGHWIRQFRPAL